MKKNLSQHIIVIICICVTFLLPIKLFSQIQPPGIDWYNGYWNDEDFCDDEISQAQSGEDWFYDVNKSFSGGIFNGFITCGYEGKQCNPTSPLPCQEICNFNTVFYKELRDLNGSVDLAYGKKGSVWFIDPRGPEKWYVEVGDEYGATELRKVMQTSDGNYVAVGQTRHRNDVASYITGFSYTHHIPYNPSKASGYYLEADNTRLGFAVKINATTHAVMWMYCYGTVLTNQTGLVEVSFSNIIEDISDGSLYISGRGNDANLGMDKGIVAKIESDGDLMWIEHIDHSTWTNTMTEFNSLAFAPDGSITAGGACAASGSTDRSNGTYGFIANFFPSGSGISGVNTKLLGVLTNTPPYVNFVYGLAYLNGGLSGGDLVVPCVEECAGCSFYAGRPQNVRIYRFNKVGADPFNFLNVDASLGGVEAYDMQTGIEKTSDGGFIFMTTKRTAIPSEAPILMSDGTTQTFGNPWPFNYLTSTATAASWENWFWNTDAYVAKYDATLNLEWKNTYPFLKYDNTVTNRGDIKRQECLYKIIQLPDGSFAGCGNNSANLDDHILFNLHDDCQNRAATFTYDIGATATSASYTHDILTNTTWSSNKKIRGTVVVKSGYALTINNGAIIEFADTRKTDMPTTLIVEAGARLIINRATLTSLSDCDNSIWDGVQVYGNNTLAQSPVSNQGYMSIIDGTIENARIGLRVSASAYDDQTYWYHPVYDKTGGVISTNGATFLNNWKHVEFMKYNSPTGAPNSSVFAKTSFLYDGNFTDPNLAYAPSGAYRGYSDYVSLWDVQGVSFLGCTFENSSTDETRHRGRAIYSINATYKVDNYYDCPSLPCSTIIHCKFKNVREGIKALMFTSVNGPSLTVHDADFEGVRQGIGISGYVLPYPKILSNRISLVSGGSMLYDHDEAWGIHATGCDKYDIEENSITSDFAPSDLMQRDVVGIAINNRHIENTMVYKNSTKNLRTSILPFAMNGSYGDNIGLLIKCNDQALNELNDIDLRDDGGVYGVIKDEQGGCIISTDPFLTPAGNTFTDISGGASTIHLNTDINSIPYNYNYRYLVVPETPLSFSVVANPVICNKSYDNLCPSRKITQNEDEIDFRALISAATTSTEKELVEQQYFNYLFETNNVAQVISYLLGKSAKNRHDSLTLSHAYTAVEDYTNALGILTGMSSADNVVSFLQSLNTELSALNINYNTSNSYTNSLMPLVLDSTKLTSIYAENILRITNLFEYPFRIPYDSLTSNKKENEIIRKTFANNLVDVIVYPNPNNGKFTVLLNELAYKEGKQICVTDITGRKLYYLDIEKNSYSYTLNLDNARGVYIVQVLNNTKKAIHSTKIIIK